MNLVREVGFDVFEFRNESRQIRLVNIELKSQFIAVDDTILGSAIDGDSATSVPDACDL